MSVFGKEALPGRQVVMYIFRLTLRVGLRNIRTLIWA